MITVSESICEWLDTHPLFKVAGMCKVLGIDAGNFDKCRRMKVFPEKHIEGVLGCIREYGHNHMLEELAPKKMVINATGPVKKKELVVEPVGEELVDQVKSYLDFVNAIAALEFVYESEALHKEIKTAANLTPREKERLQAGIRSKTVSEY